MARHCDHCKPDLCLFAGGGSGGGGGGGGGGGASLIMPNISITDTGGTPTATCDMTRAAIASAIENGAICIAQFHIDEGYIQLVPLSGVFDGGEDEDPYVAFVAYMLMGGGDIMWYAVTIFDDAVECFVDHTVSAP